MGRIRTLKPEFFVSRSLGKIPRDARFTFAGLWCHADDDGRGVADSRVIKGAVWPLDDDITHLDVQAHLEALAADHIVLYEAGGEDYYQILNWEKHQAASYRRGGSKYPPPPEPNITHDPAHDRMQDRANPPTEAETVREPQETGVLPLLHDSACETMQDARFLPGEGKEIGRASCRERVSSPV